MTGSATCNVPFGTSGSLSESGAITGCAAPNNATWVEQTAPSPLTSLAELVSYCETSAPQGWAATSPTGVRPTSESGTYNVIACWFLIDDPVLYPSAATTFSVTSPYKTTTTQTNGVPEFPISSLSSVLLVALLLPALLVMSSKFRARPTL